jgi:hypothetical protein
MVAALRAADVSVGCMGMAGPFKPAADRLLMRGQLSALVARELSAKFTSCSGGAMRRAQTLWEVFVLRFEEALERYRKRRLTADEAGV